MKVGVIVDNEYHSDVRVKREVRLFEDFGYQVFVLCLSFSKKDQTRQESGRVSAIFIPKKLKDVLYFFMNTIPVYEWWWAKKVKKFVRKYDLEVIHTHDLYMSKCVKKGIESTGMNVPMILDLHENYPHAIQAYKWTQGYIRSLLVRSKKWLKKEAKYLSYADRIIVLSEEFKRTLLARYNFLKEKQLVVFPNVVDTIEFDKYAIENLDDKLPASPRVLYFGVVANRRGIFRTLKSCEELLTNGKVFSLIIIGPVDAGDRDIFFSFLSKPLLKKHVVYIPWIELSQLPSYLNACDIALAPFDKNPQHESGIANKIFQYMYGSLPIIASNCKPQQELIEKYQIGETFSTDEELTQKIQFLIENEEVRKTMGKRSYNVLMSNFHQDVFKPILKELYQDLATSANPS